MNDFEQASQSGLHHVYETLSALVNMAVRLDQEKDKKYNGSVQYISALSKSIIFFEYNSLEIFANFLGYMAVNLSNNSFSNGPLISQFLSQNEMLFLSEKRHSSNQKILIDDFQSTREKLKKNPRYFANMFAVPFSLDTTNQAWNKFISLESSRNSLTHPKFNPHAIDLPAFKDSIFYFNAIVPIIPLAPHDLFDGIIAVRWYIREIFKLLSEIRSPHFFALLQGVKIIDSFCYMTMVSLSSYCNIPESQIGSLFPRYQ